MLLHTQQLLRHFIVNELNPCGLNSFTIMDAHGRTAEICRFAASARREETNQSAGTLFVSYMWEKHHVIMAILQRMH